MIADNQERRATQDAQKRDAEQKQPNLNRVFSKRG